jgi:plastocyanin
MKNQRFAMLIVVVALVGAACGGAATASATATPKTAPPVAPAATPSAPPAQTPSAMPITTPAIASTPNPTASTLHVSPAPAGLAAGVRCAETDHATPSATITWDEVMGPEATIRAGQAVVFVTTGYFPSVTEYGTNGKPAAHPCIDKRIGQDAGPMQVVVTFSRPGDYQITCRKMPDVMHTVVHVH